MTTNESRPSNRKTPLPASREDGSRKKEGKNHVVLHTILEKSTPYACAITTVQNRGGGTLLPIRKIHGQSFPVACPGTIGVIDLVLNLPNHVIEIVVETGRLLTKAKL